MAPPKLPTKLWSAQGCVTVVLDPQLVAREGALGLWEGHPRRVSVATGPDIGPEIQWTSFWHEVVEMILWDSGLHYLLQGDLKEAVCDAVGAYLAGATLAGRVRVVSPRARTEART